MKQCRCAMSINYCNIETAQTGQSGVGCGSQLTLAEKPEARNLMDVYASRHEHSVVWNCISRIQTQRATNTLKFRNLYHYHSCVFTITESRFGAIRAQKLVNIFSNSPYEFGHWQYQHLHHNLLQFMTLSVVVTYVHCI